MAKITGGAPSANVFAQNREALKNAGEKLSNAASNAIDEAGKDLKDAGVHGDMAAAHLIAAGARAIMATGSVIEGTADAFDAAGHAALAGGAASLGAMGWAAEGVSMAGRFVAKNLSRAFAALANMFTDGLLKDGKTVTVRQLAGDPNAVRFSDEMFGKAAEQLNMSADSMRAAWGSYVEALDSAMMGGLHVGFAAGHTVAVATNLAEAAVEVGAAGVLKLAEVGVKVAEVANDMAEKATVEARDVTILAAQISAEVANLLAVAGQGKVDVTVVDQKIAEFENKLAQIQG